MSYTTAQIRNIALAGHPGTGKTTLFEALLHAGGAIQTAGSIERGTTVSDFDPMEKARGHSLNTTLASTDHAGIHLNIFDTPGYPDFRGPTLSAFSAVDTVCIVVNASNGIEYGTRRMMEVVKVRNLCRVLVINKMDADPGKLGALVDQLREEFGNECLPLNLPSQSGKAVVDCFFKPEGQSEERTDMGSVDDWHQKIIDQVVEVNESVMGHYLEDGEQGLSGEELHDAFEQCLREGHLVPICFVSARNGAGIKELLDIAERLFPNPFEANPPPFFNGEEPLLAVPDAKAHVIADVFKIVNDAFVGKMSVFRVFQGTVKKDTQLFIDDGKKAFKVGHLFKLKGKDHVEIDYAIPGDIAAVAKIEDIHFDAILHDSHDEDHIHLKPIEFPKPMFGLAIEAATRGQEQKLSTALHKLAEEDPCFHVEHNPELNETVIRGLGELHLRVMLDRMKVRFAVEVKSRPPRIAYRETISVNAEGHHRHKKQTGGAGQFGEVFLRIEPLERGAGFEFIDAIKGGTIPGQYLPAVEKGVRQVLHGGAIAGYAIQDVRVTVYDGKYHDVDSKEIAFIAAGKKAFIDAIAKAKPQILEPIVDLTVSAPEQHMGDITGGLASKRARINGTDAARNGEIIIKAQVPLSELTNYATELKGSTAGRGRYDIDFSHYEPVPGNVQKQLIDSYRPHAEED